MAHKVSYYTDKRVAFLTQHNKELVVAPELRRELGLKVERIDGYDTNQLGTFSREIPRAGSQLETARKKVRIGMNLSGCKLGLASEGSFNMDPYTGMIPWNVEMVIFIDGLHDFEVVGFYQGSAKVGNLLSDDWASAEAFARKLGFPEHYMVVRPEDKDDQRIRKDIDTWTKLEDTFFWARGQSANGSVFLETDMRAHANPTRMEHIRLAAVDLAEKLNSVCSVCGIPGFWIIDQVKGLPCGMCGSPTDRIREDIYGCLKCSHRVTKKRAEKKFADPKYCDYCNP